jgi:hypothetical protein
MTSSGDLDTHIQDVTGVVEDEDLSDIDLTVEKVLARADIGQPRSIDFMPRVRSLRTSCRQTTLPAQPPCTSTNVAIASSPHPNRTVQKVKKNE